MKSQDIIRQAVKNVGVKRIAAVCGVSSSLIYKWAEGACDERGGLVNPLERTAQLFELCGDEQIIQWLSQRAGGFFVRNPPSTCKKGFEVVPATQEIVQQFADLLGSISSAAIDDAITQKEAKSIRDVWDELKSYTEGFVKCCEEGDFANLKEWLEKHPTPVKGA